MGLGFSGLGVWISIFGFHVWGLGFRSRGLGEGSEFRVSTHLGDVGVRREASQALPGLLADPRSLPVDSLKP